MKLVENLTKEEFNKTAELIGKSFVTNNLFWEFGDVHKREALVMAYMKAYVKCVYKSKSLYQNDEGDAFIGLSFSDEKALLPQIGLLISLIRIIPSNVRRGFLKFVKEIKNEDDTYTKGLHLETLMVCVSNEAQGKGRARELVDFAKSMAKDRNAPLLFDTDMKEYSDMYQHLGCELYHTKTATNGITRYNLVWKG
jgi:GNAT superfamily N-acetyltransferase